MSSYRGWIRAVPIIGTMIVSAYGVAFTWDYILKKKQLSSAAPDLDEAYVLQFYKGVSESTGKEEWKNKRVYRPWEDENNTKS
ncbi:unnamed protein product [Trichobilharzia szidati]|nr:unnamed protein product [Trichobilharzia szidati]CAH8874715.1 unnamed protein product [Trichobilharzia szidati]